MIRYTLTCGAGHEFEAWFRDSAAYEAEAQAGRLQCPLCGDREVRKAPMAPAVHGGRREMQERAALPAPSERRRQHLAQLLRAARALQRYVETHFEDVGERFPEEARRIHQGEAEARGIYGKASAEEVQELREEGIEVLPLPRLPEPDA